jgi:hypothetical protein
MSSLHPEVTRQFVGDACQRGEQVRFVSIPDGVHPTARLRPRKKPYDGLPIVSSAAQSLAIAFRGDVPSPWSAR